MADGVIRYKAGFTAVQNTVARNDNLPLRAKGLFLVIQAHITIPDRVFKKSDFFNMVCEGEKAFESAWNDLKEAGYLKTHIYTKNGKFVNEYELLDEAKPGPHTFYYDKSGKVSRTNLDLKDQRAALAEKQRENRKKEEVQTEQSEENDRTPEKGGTDRYPQNGTYGNGRYGNGTYADGTYGNGIYANGTYANGGNNNNTITKTDSNTDDKTDCKTGNNIPAPEQISLNKLSDDDARAESLYQSTEERLKKNIGYDKLLYEHSANKELLAYILRVMCEMLTEQGPSICISKHHYEDVGLVRKIIGSLDYDDIESMLTQLPAKGEDVIKSPRGFMRTCLLNAKDRKGAVCYTQQIKDRKPGAREYDFDALRRCINS